jgi:hypothetical protein
METKENYVKKRKWKYFFQQKAVEIGKFILILGSIGVLIFIGYLIFDLTGFPGISCKESSNILNLICKTCFGSLFLLGLLLIGLILYGIFYQLVEWIKTNMKIAENKAIKDWKKNSK